MQLTSQCAEFEPLRQVTSGDARVRIALLDGYADLSHPCFDGAEVQNVCTLPGPASRAIAVNRVHATHTASVVFGQRHSMVEGIAPRCSGYVLPVFKSDNNGNLLAAQDDIAAGIEKALSLNAHVLHISCGFISDAGPVSVRLKNALKQCERQGVLVVVASARNRCRHLCELVAQNGLLVVTDLDPLAGDASIKKTAGQAPQKNNALLASGSQLVGARPGGGASPRGGANGAAAMVTAVAGLLMSLQLRHGLNPQPLVVRDLLLETSHACERLVCTSPVALMFGRIHVAAALKKFQLLLGSGLAADMAEQLAGLEPETGGRLFMPAVKGS